LGLVTRNCVGIIKGMETIGIIACGSLLLTELVRIDLQPSIGPIESLEIDPVTTIGLTDPDHHALHPVEEAPGVSIAETHHPIANLDRFGAALQTSHVRVDPDTGLVEGANDLVSRKQEVIFNIRGIDEDHGIR